MDDHHGLTGWPYEDEDDSERQANELAQGHYLAMRDMQVEQALALLNYAAVACPEFDAESITTALRSVVDAYNEAAQTNIDVTTIILQGIRNHGIS